MIGGNVSRTEYISFLVLSFLLASVPTSVSSYFANYTDLIKASVIKTAGSFYLILMSYLFYRVSGKSLLKLSIKTSDILILCFFVSLLVSTLFSINSEISFKGQYYRQMGLLLYIYLVLIYFFISYQVSEDNIYKFFRVIEFTAFLISIYSLLQVLSVDFFSLQPADQKRPVSTLGSPVFLGGFLVCVLPFSLLNQSEWKLKTVRFLFPSVIITAIVFSGTRSAYIALSVQLIAGLIIYFYKNYHQKSLKYVLAALFACVITVSALVLFFPDNLYVKRLTSLFSWNENPRLILWRDSFGIFINYPLTGAGLGTFSRAFEDFYSFELRMSEIDKYFDNPHNNFLNYFYSAGIFGFLLYTAILIYGFISSLKSYLFLRRKLFLSFALFFAGYFTYGLTNFDDVTIIFYFFVLFSFFRKTVDYKILYEFSVNKYVTVIFILFVLVFSVYISFNTVNELRADRFYKQALMNMRDKKTKETIDNLNKAILTAPHNAVYRYELSVYVLDICSVVRSEDKNYLLKQVAEEISRARRNYISSLECDEVLSMVYFESGENEKAEKMKTEILHRDSVNINYRMRLADFHMRNNFPEKAKKELEIIYRYHPFSLKAAYLGAYLGYLMEDKETLMKYCKVIFSYEKDNQYARELIRKFTDKHLTPP
ncbi:MAG: O-antigen ligase family protein [Ignavibacteria bacterium]|nr:O-antigen ligase family protein [Ignavibacteria bacterium]